MSRILRAFACALPAVVLCLGPSLAVAQQPGPDPAAMMQQMQGMMEDMYKNVIRGMMSALAEPATAENLATFTKNYYDGLISRGFSEEQARRIVSSVGLPLAPTSN